MFGKTLSDLALELRTLRRAWLQMEVMDEKVYVRYTNYKCGSCKTRCSLQSIWYLSRFVKTGWSAWELLDLRERDLMTASKTVDGRHHLFPQSLSFGLVDLNIDLWSLFVWIAFGETIIHMNKLQTSLYYSYEQYLMVTLRLQISYSHHYVNDNSLNIYKRIRMLKDIQSLIMKWHYSLSHFGYCRFFMKDRGPRWLI